MAIPLYPQFRPLAQEDKNDFDAAFRLDPPEISEFTFTNLFSWKDAYHFSVSLLDAAILVRGTNARKEAQFLAPIGAQVPDAVIKKILEMEQPRFIRLPHEIASVFSPDPLYRVGPDRDNADYLFTCRDLIELKGRKFDGKRNLIRKFKSQFAYEYVKLTKANIAECLSFADYWCVLRDCDSVQTLAHEKQAVMQMVKHCELFDLRAGAIRVRNKFCAVAIAEKLNPETLVIHVLKAVPDLEGLYQAMLNEFISREAGDCAFVNLEQDLGIEGLRKAKLSYHPVRLIEKFTLAMSPAE